MQSSLKKAATFPAQLRMSKSGVSAQDLIKLPNAAVRSGVLRKKSPSIIHKMWPRRFIILLHDSIYIYGDEMSKSPNATLPLHGYKQVVRTESDVHDWCFTLTPAMNLASIKPKTFSCLSEQERCEWMISIRNEMLSLNGFNRMGSVSEQQLRALTASGPALEALYKTIEESLPVTKFSVVGSSSDSDSEDEYYDSSSNDGASESFSKDNPEHQARNKISPTSNKPIKLPPLVPIKSSTASDTVLPAKPSQNSSNNSRSKPSPAPPNDPPPKTPPTPNEPQPKSPTPDHRKKSTSLPPTPVEIIPPRYCALVDYFQHNYVNVESLDPVYEYPKENPARSLEYQCTVHDDKPDRDDLVRMLQAKQLSGTYLIRKSRQGGEKVIAYLTPNGRVVEYKIHMSGSGVSLDKTKYFGDVENLLQNYTRQDPLPRSNNFLKYGFNVV